MQLPRWVPGAWRPWSRGLELSCSGACMAAVAWTSGRWILCPARTSSAVQRCPEAATSGATQL